MESSQKNTKEAVTNLEVNEQAPIAPIESEKNEQEFAKETLAKIEGDMDSLRNAEEQIDKIESSTQLDNPALKEEIRRELDLDNKLIAFNDEARVVKEESQEKINLANRDFSKAYHHPDYRTELAKQILEARKSGGNMEFIRQGFYKKTQSEKENFEAQEKERSVAEIMKEKDTVIVHGMPMALDSFGHGRGSDFNNKVINNKNPELKFEDTYDIIASLEPTISASIASPERSGNGLYMRQGVILGEGKVLSAKTMDSASVAFGLKKRIPKDFNDDHKHSAIQPEINIDKVLVPGKSIQESGHNELVIENPKIAGLFIDMTIINSEVNAPIEELKPRYGYDRTTYSDDGIETEHWRSEERIRVIVKEARELEIRNKEKDLLKMKEYSEKMNVPLYILKNENGELKKYKVSFGEGAHTADYLEQKEMGFSDDAIPEKDKELIYPYDLIPVTASEIYDHKPEISEEEKNRMAQNLKDKNIIK